MTAAQDLLLDGFGRVRERVHAVVDGAGEDVLTARITPAANSIAWLVWHLLRVQDDHVAEVAEVAGTEQVWTARDWFGRFGLPFPESATGYGFSSEDVGRVAGVSAGDLAAYADDVVAATEAFVATLADDDFDRVVDDNWDPPVTLGVRLMSVLDDDLEHVGQAAFLRGLPDLS